VFERSSFGRKHLSALAFSEYGLELAYYRSLFT
jgi:hypothetical protein